MSNVGLHFAINGQIKQKGVTSDMIFPIPDLISFVSGIMKLEEGDVILTGTPKGVGQVKAGETVSAKLTYPGVDGEVVDQYEFEVVDRQNGLYEFKG
jgi:acylpyruvate hydrolase